MVQRFVLLRKLAIEKPSKCDDHPLKGVNKYSWKPTHFQRQIFCYLIYALFFKIVLINCGRTRRHAIHQIKRSRTVILMVWLSLIRLFFDAVILSVKIPEKNRVQFGPRFLTSQLSPGFCATYSKVTKI